MTGGYRVTVNGSMNAMDVLELESLKGTLEDYGNKSLEMHEEHDRSRGVVRDPSKAKETRIQPSIQQLDN